MQSPKDQTQCIQAQWKMLITLQISSLSKKQGGNNFSKHFFLTFKLGSNSLKSMLLNLSQVTEVTGC